MLSTNKMLHIDKHKEKWARAVELVGMVGGA